MMIRTRLTFRFTLLVTAIMAVTFASIYWFSWYFLSSDFYRRLDRKAVTTGDLLLQRRVDAKLLAELSQFRRDHLPNQQVVVYDRTDVVIYRTGDTVLLPVRTAVLEQVRQEGRTSFRINNAYGAGVLYKTPAGQYVVVATAQNTIGDEFLNRMAQMMGLLFLGIMALVGFSGWLYTGDALLPMQRIENHLNQIFPRTLSERLIADTTDEPGRLSATINRLLDRIEESFSLQRMFVANVSHELKNPLTQISSQLEVLLLRERSPAEYERVIRSVLDDVGDLTSLTHELLQLSKVSSEDATVLLTESVRVDEVLWDVQQEVTRLNERYVVEVDLEALPDDFERVAVPGNTALLKTALKNLVENACKFSVDSRAMIHAQFEKEAIDVTVSNYGEPIPDKDLPYIFQPFYRSQQTAEVRGYGIGLSLVDRIVRLHGGRLQVRSESDPQLTTFQVRLPYQSSF
ncbi:HAMP domain-containing sensor histidine kinase [Nibrella saemangeumensis]|uniref:histidine kinase n=1 Tax=Nibrella saemangeumensis TaxID=1084526 RepID=A0ABP8MVK8_9BACT